MQEPFEVYGLTSAAMEGDVHMHGWQEVQQFMSQLTDVDGTEWFVPRVEGEGGKRRRRSRPDESNDAAAATATAAAAAAPRVATTMLTSTPDHTTATTNNTATTTTQPPKRKRAKTAGGTKRGGKAGNKLRRAPAAAGKGENGGAGSGGEGQGLSKKQRHILSEQRRRKTIADKFNALRESVPGLESHDNKVAVLTRTVEYLHDLQQLVRAQGLDAQRPRDYLETRAASEYAESDGTNESAPSSDAAPLSPVVAPKRTRKRAPRAAAAAAAATVAAVAAEMEREDAPLQRLRLDEEEEEEEKPRPRVRVAVAQHPVAQLPVVSTQPPLQQPAVVSGGGASFSELLVHSDASSHAAASSASGASSTSVSDDDDDEEEVEPIEFSQMLGMADMGSAASGLISDEEARLSSGGDSPLHDSAHSPSSLWQGDLWGDARKFAFVFCVGFLVFVGDMGLGAGTDSGAAAPTMTARVLHAWNEPSVTAQDRLLVTGGALYGLARQAIVLAWFFMLCVVVMLSRGGKRHGRRSPTLRAARAERTCAEELTTSHSTASEKEARFLKVLGLLGVGMPHSKLHTGLGIAAQVLRNIVHMTRVGVWLDRMVTQARGATETLVEAQAALHGVYLIKTRDARLTGDAVYALLASLNYGECVGPSAELVEAYGSLALLLESNVVLCWMAPYFRSRATEVEMELLPEERKSASVHRYEAYMAICTGATVESERALGRYHEMCLTSPKHSFLLADCWGLFAILYTFQGRHVHALKVNHAIHEKALRSQEAFFQLRSLLGMARCLLELGEHERAMVALDQVSRRQLLDSAAPRGVERQVYHAVLALASHRMGDGQGATHHARIASEMGTGKWQYRVFHFLAYAACAEARLEMLEDELDLCSLTGASCGLGQPTVKPCCCGTPVATPAGSGCGSGPSSAVGTPVGTPVRVAAAVASGEGMLTPLSHKGAEATSSLYDSSFDAAYEGHITDDLSFAASADTRAVCNNAYKDLANLRRFARQYPVALAYAHRLHGRYYFLKRMHNQSLRCFRRGIAFAQQYHLANEERECRATLQALRPVMRVNERVAETHV